MTTVTDIGTLIVRTPGLHGGRPHLAGTGVTVQRIVGWYREGLTPEEITAKFGHITLAQVHGALAYYHANREEVEAHFATEQAEYERLALEHALQPQSRA